MSINILEIIYIDIAKNIIPKKSIAIIYAGIGKCKIPPK